MLVRANASVCVYALKIASRENILLFKNTFILQAIFFFLNIFSLVLCTFLHAELYVFLFHSLAESFIIGHFLL